MGSLEERRTDQPISSEQLYKAGFELEYDPVQSKLVPKTSRQGNCTKSCENGFCEMDQQMSSEDLYKAGVELEFDPFQSKLVPKTPKQPSGTSKTEEAYKKGQGFEFDPASGRLIPIKKQPVDEVEQQLRDASSDRNFGFDKKKKCLKVEEKPQRDKQVKVDMNRRGTGGFF